MSFSQLPHNAEIYLVDEGSSGCRLYKVDQLCRWPLITELAKITPRLIYQVQRTQSFDPVARAQALSLFEFTARTATKDSISIGIGTEVFRVVKENEASQYIEDAKEAFRNASPYRNEIDFQIIKGSKEAALAAKGVLFSFPRARGVVVHIGGGSVDFSYIDENGNVAYTKSLHIGADKLKELFLNNRDKAAHLSEAQLFKRMSEFVATEINSISWLNKLPKDGLDLYIEGGNCRAVGRAFIKLANYPIQIVHGLSMDRDQYSYLLAKLSPTFMTNWKISTQQITGRRETMPITRTILEAITERLNIDHMIVSETGVREGIIYEAMPDDMRVLSPLLAACPGLCTPSEDIEVVQARAKRIKNWVNNFLPKTSLRSDVLEAICLISDGGSSATKHNKAKAVYHAVMEHQFGDLSHEERAIMALALYARYSGKVKHDETTEASNYLANHPEKIQLAELIGQTIGLAYQFGYASPQIDTVSISKTKDCLTITIPSTMPYIETKEVSGFVEAIEGSLGRAVELVIAPSRQPSFPPRSERASLA